MKGSNTDTPVISIGCMAYNQQDYIADALDGMVNQDIDVPYEIIVCDDASTDSTQDIIRDYAKRYPDIIKPILHKENQHSKNNGGFVKNIVPHVTGKYLAICEGDDYWCDKSKLKKQYQFLEEHPDYTLCLHNCLIIDYYANLLYLSEYQDKDIDKSMNCIIKEGGGKINPTASMFFRKDAFFDIQSAPVGDHFFMMQLASEGKVRWINKPMSVYRFHAKGSWHRRMSNNTPELQKRNTDRYVYALDCVDKKTEYKYHDAFEERKNIQKQLYANYLKYECRAKNNESALNLKGAVIKHMPENILRAINCLRLKKILKNSNTFVGDDVNNVPSFALPLTSINL